ncbi:MAG: methylenetetrahydrofolate reductase, partial [Candidatus Omnitrophota bacterium]
LKVYAAIDQYRSSLEKEYEYIQRKIDAGACGFFTQPFFDLNLLEDYLKKLAGIDVFWGVSPVITEKSKKYWEDNNKVKFPADFSLTLEWNRHLAAEMFSFTKEIVHAHIYFMPIKMDFVDYLTGII